MTRVWEVIGRHRLATTIITMICVLWVAIPVVAIVIYGMLTP